MATVRGLTVEGPFGIQGQVGPTFERRITFLPDEPDDTLAGFVISAWGDEPILRFRQGGASGATSSNPAAPLNGAFLGAVTFQAWDGTQFRSTAVARAAARENFTTTATGSSFDVRSIPLGSAVLADRFRGEPTVTADDIALSVFDVSAGALKQVSRGAADSGGVGFRRLRIPN